MRISNWLIFEKCYSIFKINTWPKVFIGNFLKIYPLVGLCSDLACPSLIREHFPFFRVAPDGWKNTVRHNLCFSSSFEKSAGWVCADGHRRSCLWKLTRQGRTKFRAEMHALSEELMRVLRRSMNKPGNCKCVQHICHSRNLLYQRSLLEETLMPVNLFSHFQITVQYTVLCVYSHLADSL